MIPNFEMIFDRNRIEILYKGIEILGIDSPPRWKEKNSENHIGWILHRWVHFGIINTNLDSEIIKNTGEGFGIKIIGVDEI